LKGEQIKSLGLKNVSPSVDGERHRLPRLYIVPMNSRELKTFNVAQISVGVV
jgi:hypothetical protein